MEFGKNVLSVDQQVSVFPATASLALIGQNIQVGGVLLNVGQPSTLHPSFLVFGSVCEHVYASLTTLDSDWTDREEAEPPRLYSAPVGLELSGRSQHHPEGCGFGQCVSGEV